MGQIGSVLWGARQRTLRLVAAIVGCWLLASTASAPLWGADAVAVPQVLVVSGQLHARLLSGGGLDENDRHELVRLPLVLKRQFAPGVTAPGRGPLRFVTLGGTPLAAGATIPAGGVRLLPVEPGRTALRLQKGLFETAVVRLEMVSERSGSSVVRERLSISGSLPAELALSRASAVEDREAVRVRLIGPDSAVPNALTVTSFGPNERYLDSLQKVPLHAEPCPDEGTSMLCASTVPLRLVVDGVERNHPKVKERSLMGEVGGRVEVRLADDAHRRFLVAGPDGLTTESDGPGRYRMNIIARLVNMQAGGPPPVGESVEEALRLVREELDLASRLWGQCGIVLGPPEEWDIKVVDPPEIALVEVGCRGGLRASGGTVSLLLKPPQGPSQKVVVRSHPGQSPLEVARALHRALLTRGFSAELWRNAQVVTAALPSFDLLIKDRQGRAVSLAPTGRSWTDDPTLGICQGKLDLADGLEHFTDFNAAAGTLEERILLRALSDDDPSTIELIVVPIFSGEGRIGESFIHSPGGSLKNALILDRGGIRASARSLTLAHELGHILLEMPGHPDDFGVDTPTSLMDADAADATIFGPRRLSLSDCRRALIQSGAKAPTPLLAPWPFE